jgi:uncharacterized membrane protein YdjX (TVP38/TMEM64 family)
LIVGAGNSGLAWRVVLAGAVVLLAVAAYWLLGDRLPVARGLFSLSESDVEAFMRSWGMWSVAASLFLMVLHSFVPVPAEIIAVCNGLVFGAAGGIAATWLGAMLGAAAAFALARWLGRPFVCRFVADAQRARLEEWTGGADALLMLRLVPLVSFNLVNYAAGLAGVGWWTFLWTTAVGILPLTVLTAVLGSRMLEISWPLWAAIAAGVIVLWLIGRRLRQSR